MIFRLLSFVVCSFVILCFLNVFGVLVRVIDVVMIVF